LYNPFLHFYWEEEFPFWVCVTVWTNQISYSDMPRDCNFHDGVLGVVIPVQNDDVITADQAEKAGKIGLENITPLVKIIFYNFILFIIYLAYNYLSNIVFLYILYIYL